MQEIKQKRSSYKSELEEKSSSCNFIYLHIYLYFKHIFYIFTFFYIYLHILIYIFTSLNLFYIFTSVHIFYNELLYVRKNYYLINNYINRKENISENNDQSRKHKFSPFSSLFNVSIYNSLSVYFDVSMNVQQS